MKNCLCSSCNFSLGNGSTIHGSKNLNAALGWSASMDNLSETNNIKEYSDGPKSSKFEEAIWIIDNAQNNVVWCLELNSDTKITYQASSNYKHNYANENLQKNPLVLDGQWFSLTYSLRKVFQKSPTLQCYMRVSAIVQFIRKTRKKSNCWK